MDKIEKKLYKKLLFNTRYTVRRYFIDKFYYKELSNLPSSKIVIDVGGKRAKKKGLFNVDEYFKKVLYVNIDKSVEPDFVCDANNMPFKSEYADIVICSDMLEHTQDPIGAIREIYRVLKKGGKAYICVPFNTHLHNEPEDYGRPTKYFWKKVFEETGFKNITIRNQGNIYAVKANMLRAEFKQLRRNKRSTARLLLSPH